jgi:hypothetical protein
MPATGPLTESVDVFLEGKTSCAPRPRSTSSTEVDISSPAVSDRALWPEREVPGTDIGVDGDDRCKRGDRWSGISASEVGALDGLDDFHVRFSDPDLVNLPDAAGGVE